MRKKFAIISVLLTYATCRDFYMGMFKRNDYLVAQDRLSKERVPYRFTIAKYGRLFKCPITYFRIVDRLGLGRGPRVEITRGGLRYKYITLRLISMYNSPISVNIYVGCSPETTTKRQTTRYSSGEEELKDFGLSEDDSKKKANKTSNVSKGDSRDISIATTVRAGRNDRTGNTTPNDEPTTAMADVAATSPAVAGS